MMIAGNIEDDTGMQRLLNTKLEVVLGKRPHRSEQVLALFVIITAGEDRTREQRRDRVLLSVGFRNATSSKSRG